MCGNGIRCLARFVAAQDRQQGAAQYTVHTLAGLIRPALLEDGQVRRMHAAFACNTRAQ